MNFTTLVCTRCKHRKSDEGDYNAHDGWRRFDYEGDRSSRIQIQLCPKCFQALRDFLDCQPATLPVRCVVCTTPTTCVVEGRCILRADR
jgi:hypothetical protein